jgi:hypothetical protein
MNIKLLLWILFGGIELAILWGTISASIQCALWKIPADVFGHPWFTATLVDAYGGFFTFLAWFFYVDRRGWSRALMTIGVLLLGNIVMASYMLWRLWSYRFEKKIDFVFTGVKE